MTSTIEMGLGAAYCGLAALYLADGSDNQNSASIFFALVWAALGFAWILHGLLA